jgi:glycosidase
MQWDASKHGGFSSAQEVYSEVIAEKPYNYQTVNVAAAINDPDSLYYLTKRMISVHKSNKALGWGDFAWAQSTQSDKVAAYLRTYDGQMLLILHNLTRLEQDIVVELPRDARLQTPVDLLSGLPKGTIANDRLSIEVPPLGYYWLKLL